MVLFPCLRCRFPALLVFLLGVFIAGQAPAQTASDAEIIQAVDQLYRGGPGLTDRSRALVIEQNGRINSLAADGRIDLSRYQKAQEYFSNANTMARNRAASQVGVRVTTQPRPSGRPYNPGTDTDALVTRVDASSPPITKRQLDALDTAHQREMKRIIRGLGRTPPAGRLDTNTDFMPVPEHTTPEVFAQQSREINARGGAAYNDPAAVRVEYQTRPGGRGNISVSDAGRYVTEMQYHADRHFQGAEDLNRQARALSRAHPNPTAAQQTQINDLQVRARIKQHQGVKYVQRINDVSARVGRQFGVEVQAPPATDLDRAVQRAAGTRAPLPTDGPAGPLGVRPVEMSTIKSAGLSEQLTRKAVLTHAETMARVAGQVAAHSPGQALAARDSIARSMARLPPAQQGELILQVERTAGKQFASDVARQARQYQRPVPTHGPGMGQRAAEAVGTAMKVVAILNVAQDIKEIVTADDPRAVLEEKAMTYADGIAGGAITTAGKLGDQEHLVVEHDAYLRNAEAVLYQALEAKLRRMGVERDEARRITNDYYRGDTRALHAKAAELRAAGVVDPHPERSGVEGISAWDQDDTALERLEQIAQGIGHGVKRAVGFAQEAVTDTAEILVGLTETGVVKELIWERDPRLLVDIYRESQARDASVSDQRQAMIDYLEALGASPVGARRATAALLDDGDVSDFRRLVGVLEEKADERRRALTAAAEADADTDDVSPYDDFTGWASGTDGEPVATEPERDLANAVAEILDGAGGVRVIRGEEGSAGVPSPNTVVLAHSGNWSKAYGGWRTEERPPNPPVQVGPVAVGPGKYRAELSYSPDIRASMTAGNFNTGMSLTHRYRGLPGEGDGVRAASLRPGARDRPRGDAAIDFTLDRPGQLEAVFTVAASRGQAGGYAEHEQSYSGRVVFLEPLADEAGTSGTVLISGDTVRAGSHDATVGLWDGTLMLVRAGSEMRIENMEDGRLRVTVLKGAGRFSRRGDHFGRIEVVAPDGRHLVRPEGTDFVVTPTTVEVIEGSVLVVDEEQEPVRVEAHQRMRWSDGELEPLEPELLQEDLSADGIPLRRDFWVSEPDHEPYGAKLAKWDDTRLADGWLFADPPARWKRGTRPGPRAAAEAVAADTLRLVVPNGSRLDDQGDTAPRLLHKVTGDFILEAKARIEDDGREWASLQFVARAPGAFPGAKHGQFRRNPADGAGQHYWLGAPMLVRTSGGILRVTALNDTSQTHWPEAGSEAVRVRLRRDGDLWSSAWSRDGTVWHTNSIARPELPETLWVGWTFINTARAAAPVTFLLSDVRLETALRGSQAVPRWYEYASHGSVAVKTPGSVHLSLDGRAPGTARAFMTEPLVGDFDVEIRFEADASVVPAGGIRRWSVAVVDLDERGLAVGSEVTASGQRYGVVHQTTGGYNVRTSMQHGSAVVEEPEGRLRLVRSDGVLTAWFWRGGDWRFFRQLPYRGSGQAEFKGPMLLRLEAANGSGPISVPVTVRFDMHALYDSPAERLRQEGVALQAEGELFGALEKYRASLELAQDSALEDRIRRLETYFSVADPGLARRISLPPGATPEEGPLLLPGQEQRATLEAGDTHWYRVHLPVAGELVLELHGYDELGLNVLLLDGGRRLAQGRFGSGEPGRVSRADLGGGEFQVSVQRVSGEGPYRLAVVHQPQTYGSDREPNDGFEQAQPLPLARPEQGLLGYLQAGNVDAVDWFVVTVDAPGDLRAVIETEEALTVALALIHSDGRRELARDAGRDDNRYALMRPGIAPGQYFVRVQRRGGHGGYQLRADLEPARAAADVEPNDTAEQAQPIPVDAPTTGLLGFGNPEFTDTVDWFVVTMERPGTLSVELEADATLTPFLYLLDLDGRRELARDAGGSATLRSIERAGLAPGSYFVRIQRANGYGGYTLVPGVVPAGVEGDREPNDVVEQAQPLPLNRALTGLLGFGNQKHTDTVDWFSVTLDASGGLRVHLTAEETLQPTLYLHGVDGRRELARDIKGTAGTWTLERADLVPGTYFIRVQRSSGHGRYELSTSVVAGDP